MSERLEIRGLSKSYRSGRERLRILVDLDLTVQAGRMVAIMGASGSGKSTFLHLVGGMEKPESGSIRFRDQEITRLQGRELARYRNRTVGFVFQFHYLLPEFDARENAMFPLLLRGASHQQASERAEALLEEVGLADRMRHRPGELSGGEQQRVAIARALAGEPRLLLADEPTGNLDPATSERIYELLAQVHRSHRLTSLIATHNAALADLCNVRKEVSQGKLV